MLKEIIIYFFKIILFYSILLFFGTISLYLITLFFDRKNIKEALKTNIKIAIAFFIYILGFKILFYVFDKVYFFFTIKYSLVLLYGLITTIIFFYFIYKKIEEDYNLKKLENMIVNFLYITSMILFFFISILIADSIISIIKIV